MVRINRAIALAACITLLPLAAWAGISDSPVPALMGSPAKAVYDVTGVINANGLGTYFACTNVDKAAITVGVEVFDAPGGGPVNNASATSVSVAVGQTALFGTQSSAGLLLDSVVGAPVTTHGSARILSTSSKLLCSAYVTGVTGIPTPASLPVFAKLKQRGQ